MANLHEPLFLKLPRMSVYSNKKNSDGTYNIYYCIDLDDPECSKLIEFLYNLDSSAIDQCVKKSQKWFNGRRITKDILENKYIPPYNSNDHDVVFMKVSVRDIRLLKKIKNPHITTIRVEGLEFYKNNFMYSLVVERVDVDELIEVESKLDFIKYINTSRSSARIRKSTPPPPKQQEVINDEIINELANYDNYDDQDNHTEDHNDQNVQENNEVHEDDHDDDHYDDHYDEVDDHDDEVDDHDDNLDDDHDNEVDNKENDHEDAVHDTEVLGEEDEIEIDIMDNKETDLENKETRTNIIQAENSDDDSLELLSNIEDSDSIGPIDEVVISDDDIVVQVDEEQEQKKQEDEQEKQEEEREEEDILSRAEVKSLIEDKRSEVKSYFENAERANKTAENCRLKAIQAASELRQMESELRSMGGGDNDE
jgi:hypothetical protein